VVYMIGGVLVIMLVSWTDVRFTYTGVGGLEQVTACTFEDKTHIPLHSESDRKPESTGIQRLQ
jgi:hypothetical protein